MSRCLWNNHLYGERYPFPRPHRAKSIFDLIVLNKERDELEEGSLKTRTKVPFIGEAKSRTEQLGKRKDESASRGRGRRRKTKVGVGSVLENKNRLVRARRI